MKKTLNTLDKQLLEYKQLVEARDRELESMSMELALSLSEIFEVLKKIAAGDPWVRIQEESEIELINKLKHIINLTAGGIGEIVDQSHEFAIVLAEHFDVLLRVSTGDLDARVTGVSQIELMESLKRVTNDMIESISAEIAKRQLAEAELQKSYDKLEQRVIERTAELRIMNEKLTREIMERKKAEEELRQTELRYRTVADFTHDLEYWEAHDGTLRYISPSSERIIGYTSEEVTANPALLAGIIIPADRDIWASHHHNALEASRPSDIIFRVRRKDGQIRWIEHVCQAVTDSNGNFLGVRASNRDITMRKQAEEKLKGTLSLLSATLESTADGILVVDRKGKIVSFNQKFVLMWHIPESVLETGDDNQALTFVLDQLKDPEGFMKKTRDLYAHPEAESYDILEFHDGKIIERYSHPQKIGDSIIGRVWSFRDLTAHKQAEKALRESEQLLLQAQKMEALGRLSAGVAHEINNPLAIINEKAGLMKDLIEFSGDLTQNKEKFLSLIRGIFESVSRCRTITHRLLGFSRRVEVSYDMFDLNDMVREVIEFIEKEALYKNIRLEMILAEGLPKILIDKGLLQQVFLNILNNAVDAVDKGGGIDVVTGMKDENTLLVSIKDNGHGIPKEIVSHIFEPFYTTKIKGKGTGLGLSISYGIMQKLGGNILVRSEVDQGTVFIIEIPIKAKTE